MKRELTCLILLQFCVVIYLSALQRTKPKKEDRQSSMPIKSILIWNSVKRIETAYFNVGSASFVREHCPVHQCQIFTDRNALPFELYDAVVMNMLEVHELPHDLSFTRFSHQRFVFLQQESPLTSPLDLKRYDNYFNWTVNYKLDSDILLLYGRIKAKRSAPKSQLEVKRLVSDAHWWNKNYPVNKTKPVVWMVSHCETDGFRETYVSELKKYIEVDVYGECGSVQLNCSRSLDWIPGQECYDLLAADYKFYLSFENSVCDDYVTEKFFNILAHDLVPVVYGGANYSKLAPPHSFIDALRFTPKQLARYLNRIANDDRLYNEFFWWKEHYEVETGVEQMVRHAFCDLCQKLHEDNEVKVYERLSTFWNESQCTAMKPWDVNYNQSADTDVKLIEI